MTGAITFLVAILALGFMIAIPWAMMLDRRDEAEYHIMHGPNDGCRDCEDK